MMGRSGCWCFLMMLLDVMMLIVVVLDLVVVMMLDSLLLDLLDLLLLMWLMVMMLVNGSWRSAFGRLLVLHICADHGFRWCGINRVIVCAIREMLKKIYKKNVIYKLKKMYIFTSIRRLSV